MERSNYYRTARTIFDPPAAAVIFLAALPLFAVVALVAAAATRKNPFFFRRRALACGSREFTLVKFRTMRGTCVNSVTELNEAEIFRRPLASADVPGVCRLLRRTGLDELPQLINVMKGEMSLIGPRPLDMQDLEAISAAYPDLNERRKNLPVRPGITGLWQMYGDRNRGSKNMVALDEEYVLSHSFVLDLRIMLATIRHMALAKHDGLAAV